MKPAVRLTAVLPYQHLTEHHLINILWMEIISRQVQLSVGSAQAAYTIYAKDAANVTADSTITITDTPGPQENVTITQGSCSNPNGNINITAIGGTAPLQYSIDGITYQSSGIFDNLNSGKYIAYVKDANGCITTDTVQIAANRVDLFCPTHFLLTAMGLNDIFRIKYPFAVKAFSFVVYNRLGEKMFETNDMAKGWDGTCKGTKQPMDVYVWVIHLTTLNNIEQTSRGIVTLLK